MSEVIALGKGRSVLAASLQEWSSLAVPRPFAALVPAFDEGEVNEVLAAVRALLGAGCVELCAVGPRSEALHDAIDDIVVEDEVLGVFTTWHEDLDDGCGYFVRCAGGSRRRLPGSRVVPA